MPIKLVERRSLPTQDLFALNHPAGGVIIVADLRVSDATLESFCDYVRRRVELHPDVLNQGLPGVIAAASDALAAIDLAPIPGPVQQVPRPRRVIPRGTPLPLVARDTPKRAPLQVVPSQRGPMQVAAGVIAAGALVALGVFAVEDEAEALVAVPAPPAGPVAVEAPWLGLLAED